MKTPMAEEEELPAYQPGPGFEQDSREQLVDISPAISSSTELWLIQWPHNDLPNIHGKELSISLDSNGCSASFEDLSGKMYEIVGTDQEQGPSVFMSSVSETEIVGNISRRVSLVHYPDPKELEQRDAAKKSKRLHLMTSSSSMKNSSQRSSSKMTKSRGPGASTYSNRDGSGSSARRQTPTQTHRGSASKGGRSSMDSKQRHNNSTDLSGPSGVEG